ncbi:hypothetical protein [Campylobacter molothri]|nr:hypothetical protein [Campylobacter sp. RM12397]
MSVEEFKQKWLDLQAKHEARFGEIAEQSRKDIQQEMQTAQEQEIKTFKPIRAESKSQTYKDEVKANFWEQFLKIQKENGIDILELMEKLNEKGIDKRI